MKTGVAGPLDPPLMVQYRVPLTCTMPSGFWASENEVAIIETDRNINKVFRAMVLDYI